MEFLLINTAPGQLLQISIFLDHYKLFLSL